MKKLWDQDRPANIEAGDANWPLIPKYPVGTAPASAGPAKRTGYLIEGERVTAVMRTLVAGLAIVIIGLVTAPAHAPMSNGANRYVGCRRRKKSHGV